jgi:CotH protein/invasin-like protein
MRAALARVSRALALACALLCPVFAAVTAAQAAEPTGDAAAPLYQPGSVNVIDLTLDQAGIDALEAEPDEYVSGGFSLSTNSSPGDKGDFSPPLVVGIRLKGGKGSFRDLTEKAAFKIKFNEFVSGQKFLGLKKMTLNNMVQDASMIHEVLAYKAFRSLGVPASRTGYAYVYLNGEDFGMHLNIETLDDVYLKKWFGSFQEPPQHLYEGEYKDDVRVADVGKFEIDEGEDDRSDLIALATAADGSTPADFSDRVGPFADLAEMTRMWAVEKYIGHWDGYSGKTEFGYDLPNNYYLYSDPAGVFQMMPWGTDQTWADRSVAFGGEAGRLFDDCIADETCAALYDGALEGVPAEVDGDYKSLATSTAALLKPWQELEQGNGARHESSLTQIDESVQWAREFIDERPDDLAKYLAGQAGYPASQIELTLQPDAIAADGHSTSTATATVTDAFDDPVPGDAIAFSSTDPGQIFGTIADGDDGTYAVQVTSSATIGAATVTATNESVVPAIFASATLSQVSPPLAAHPPAIVPPPVVRILRKPPRRTRNRRPVFAFVSDQPGATFICEVDDRGARGCTSPKKLLRLGLGPHAFSVSAVGGNGQVGPATTHRFFVKPRHASR